jgi:large repetitive protein
MNLIAALLLAGSVTADPMSVSGTVTDERGKPLTNARVFLEPGLALKLVEGQVGADGSFQFTNLRPGLVGLIGLADGFAVTGTSVEVGVDEPVTGVEVRLGAPQSVAGKVTDPRGRPVEKAMLVGVLLDGVQPVGIPIRKLNEYGVATPATDASGAYRFDRAPAGTLALKFAHPEFAQQTLRDVASGSETANVTLDPGVLVQGVVRARGSQLPVGRAALLVAEAGPGRSTAVVVTDNRGQFAIKLSPGRYACQASSAQFRSPGWETMNVTGQQIVQEVTLYVAGTGSVRGQVRDASSGDPVPNVRLALDAFDNTVDMSTTGANGGFALRGQRRPERVARRRSARATGPTASCR